jgi:hypothetical protein
MIKKLDRPNFGQIIDHEIGQQFVSWSMHRPIVCRRKHLDYRIGASSNCFLAKTFGRWVVGKKVGRCIVQLFVAENIWTTGLVRRQIVCRRKHLDDGIGASSNCFFAKTFGR